MLQGHNNPPGPWTLEHGVPCRVPGHIRAWMFSAKEDLVFRIECSHDDTPEKWWPIHAPYKGRLIAFETFSPWTYVRYTVDRPEVEHELTVGWAE